VSAEENKALPPGVTRHPAWDAPAEAEIERMTELALRRGAISVIIGRGRSTGDARAADAFARRWEDRGHVLLDVVTWPEEAASWLRQATRFTAANPDLWIMTGAPFGWAQMTRRLLWSTPWQPGQTLAFACLGNEDAIGLVGAHNLHGLSGATRNGGTWKVCSGTIWTAPPGPGNTR
jgi:hypothetical protein